MASTYNRVGRPAVVFVRDGRARGRAAPRDRRGPRGARVPVTGGACRAPVRVALLGLGTVGAEVAASALATRVGRSARRRDRRAARARRRRRRATRRRRARRRRRAPLLTTDAAALLAEAGPDVVVELIGGTTGVAGPGRARPSTPARPSSPPTSRCSPPSSRALTERAASRGVDLLLRGGGRRRRSRSCACCATSLAGQRLERVLGIVNGTTNFILTTMAKDGRDVDDVARRGDGARASPSATRPRTSTATTRPRRPRSSPRSRSAAR